MLFRLLNPHNNSIAVVDILAQLFKHEISKFGDILTEKCSLAENHVVTAEIVAQDREPPVPRQNSLGYQRFAWLTEVLGWSGPALLNCDKHNMSTPQLSRQQKRSEASALLPWISAKVLASISVKQLLLQDELFLASVADVGVIMTASLSRGGRIFFCGNGGSAADAQHLAAELTGRFLKERPSLAGIALTTNTSTLTAIANDYSYEEIFSRQIEGLAQPGDVLLGISTSGNSANVLRAIDVARRMRVSTVALTGKTGGKLAARAEHCIRIPSDETPRIQEGHILTGHILAEIVEAELFGE